MDESVRGLVLKVTNYLEADKLLTILSFEKGKIVAKARGANKAKSKLKAFCQPFCFANFELVKGKAGYILSGVKAIDNFFATTSDIHKYSYAFSILEIFDKICVENEDYHLILLDGIRALKEMNYSDTNPVLILSRFFLDVLRHEGFKINLKKCANCGGVLEGQVYFSFKMGGMLCSNCGINDGTLISNGVFSALKILSQNSYERLHSIRFSKEILESLFELLKKDFYCRFDIVINSLNL